MMVHGEKLYGLIQFIALTEKIMHGSEDQRRKNQEKNK